MNEIFFWVESELYRSLVENIFLMVVTDSLCLGIARCDFELEEEDCEIFDDTEAAICFDFLVLLSS